MHSDACACPVPCAEIHYESGITYASASGRNIDSPSGGNVTNALRAKYVKARETGLFHRLYNNIVCHFGYIVFSKQRHLALENCDLYSINFDDNTNTDEVREIPQQHAGVFLNIIDII